MTETTDAALAVAVVIALAVGMVTLGTAPSPPALVVGGVLTAALEVVASMRANAIRRVWERPAVRGASLLAALVVVALAVRVGSTPVLSAGLGAAGTYLVLWVLVSAGVVSPVSEWREQT